MHRWQPGLETVLAAVREVVPYEPAPPWKDVSESPRGAPEAATRWLASYLLLRHRAVSAAVDYHHRASYANADLASLHATGRAIDLYIGKNPPSDEDLAEGDEIAVWLVTHAGVLGVQYVVWGATAWQGTGTLGAFSPYGGPDPHFARIHIELTALGARGKTAFYAANGFVAPPEPAIVPTARDTLPAPPESASEPAA